MLLDVGWKLPTAADLIARAANAAEVAASDGEATKAKRYAPARGRIVTPAILEAWGHIAPKFKSWLLFMSQLAANHQFSRGLKPSHWKRIWFSELSTMAAKHAGYAIVKSRLDPNAILGDLQV